VKTTLEIPDAIFRKAKVKAAERGIPLRQFVTEAVEEKLAATPAAGEKPWMKFAGGLRHLHYETVRINKLIEEEFEQIGYKCTVGVCRQHS
jgi:hypothetical protein